MVLSENMVKSIVSVWGGSDFFVNVVKKKEDKRLGKL